MTAGVRVPLDTAFLERVDGARMWDGAVLPPGLQARLRGQWAQWQHLTAQLRELKAAQRPDLTTQYPCVEAGVHPGRGSPAACPADPRRRGGRPGHRDRP